MLDIRRHFWPLIGLCALGAALVLALMPAEKTLGQIIKLVYLHGALSRAGMIGFWAAAIAGAAHLIRPNPRSLRWSQALLWSGCGFWVAHFIVSMPATRLTWGPWIAWGEPRVTMTLQVAAAGLIVIAVTWLVAAADVSPPSPISCWVSLCFSSSSARACCVTLSIPSALPPHRRYG